MNYNFPFDANVHDMPVCTNTAIIFYTCSCSLPSLCHASPWILSLITIVSCLSTYNSVILHSFMMIMHPTFHCSDGGCSWPLAKFTYSSWSCFRERQELWQHHDRYPLLSFLLKMSSAKSMRATNHNKVHKFLGTIMFQSILQPMQNIRMLYSHLWHI